MSILGGGLRSIVSGVEQILLESDEEYEEEISLTKEEKIQNLQSSDDTYLTEPARPEFEDWLKDFLDKIETKKEEMTEILIEAPLVRRKYNELVPKDVSHNIFWARYLFRRKIIEEKHARAEEIAKRKVSQEEPQGQVKDDKVKEEASKTEEATSRTEKPEEVTADGKQDIRKSEEVVSLVKSEEEIKPEDEPEVKEGIKKEVVQQLKLKTAQDDEDKKISSDEDIVKIDSVTNIKPDDTPKDIIPKLEDYLEEKLEDKVEDKTEDKLEDKAEVKLEEKSEQKKQEKNDEKKSEHSDIDDWEDDLDIEDVDITDVNLDDDDWQMSDIE